jgi:hypothetical protein
MRGRKGRGHVAGIIGVLLCGGSSGNGSSMANGATLLERRRCVNHNSGWPLFVCQLLLCATPMDILRPRKRQPICERLSHRDPALAHN